MIKTQAKNIAGRVFFIYKILRLSFFCLQNIWAESFFFIFKILQAESFLSSKYCRPSLFIYKILRLSLFINNILHAESFLSTKYCRLSLFICKIFRASFLSTKYCRLSLFYLHYKIRQAILFGFICQTILCQIFVKKHNDL